MNTKFANLNQLKKGIEIGQKMYIENHINPFRSRVTKVRNKQSYFFTVDNQDGKESWIVNGADNLKHYGFTFKPDYEAVLIWHKKDASPFVTLYFNDTIIKGKETVNNINGK